MACALCDFKFTKIRACKKTSCGICLATAKLDEKISDTVATLQRLLAERRSRLRAEHNRAHDPLYRLPVELGNHIFDLTLPTRDEWGRIVDRGVMPTRLASICRGWRDIAWSNPSLWSTISIELRGRDSTSSSRIYFLCNWILRSRTLPLTLHIVVLSDVAEPVLTGVLDRISRSSSRWDSLSLQIPSRLFQVFCHCNFQCHRLRKLQIYRNHRGIDRSMSLFNSNVAPERIDLNGVSFHSLKISWNQLTSATFDRCSFADFVSLFQHAPRMTYCQLVRPGFDGIVSITHRNLKVLSLVHTSKYKGAGILDCLTLPRLQEFHTDYLGVLNLANLPALVHRSLCPLNRISLDIEGADYHQVLSLTPFPGVTDLVLETMGDEEDWVKKLLLEDYFPDLVHLTLRLQSFKCLWRMGIIPLLLESMNPRQDTKNEGKRRKILVVDESEASELGRLLNSDVGKELKMLGIKLRDDGFEFL